MTDIIAPSDDQRRLGEGLSPTLLTHASEGQHFLGFISYRRRDGLALAKWLRDRITGFQPPPELRDKIDKMDADVGGKQNRVFFDMSYQRPNVDFWDEHIAASLCRSRTLILLQTPSVFERLDDGEPNWCEREIETYLKYYGEPSRILVVMGPGAPIDRFPEPLAKISARWDWIDLRFFSESPVRRFRHGSQYDPLVAKILAKIYNIADGDLPLLNREFAKARANVRRALAVAACTAIVSLSGLTAWALKERDRATAAEQVAVEQRDTAIRQRNAALIAQSRFLAKSADEQNESGSARAAIAILREALPDSSAGRDRPLVVEAVGSAYRAIYDNRERGRMPLPPDASAIASNGTDNLIVIATGDRLIVQGKSNTSARKEMVHDFGTPKSVSLSTSGTRVAMIAADGSVMVRDLTDNRSLLRDSGVGSDTKATFLHGGLKLLVSDAARHTLRLYDLESGKLAATRTIATPSEAPAASFVEDGYVAVIVGGRLMRLSQADLTTIASVNVPELQQYAFALSPDRTKLYVAAADRLATGSIHCLDAETLVLQRSFGQLSFGATSMVASPTRDLLAVNTASGVDLFDLKKFETMGHITAVPLSGGRFLKDSFFYIGFNEYGNILQIVPELLTTTAYKTIDGGRIRQIDTLDGDETGFLSLSDRPSITRWSFDPDTSSKTMSVPFVVRNLNMNQPMTIAASNFSKTDDTIVAGYFGGLVKRWNLNDGSSITIKTLDPDFKSGTSAVLAMGNRISLVVAKSGPLQVYSEAAGSAEPLSQLETGKIQTLAALSDTTAFLVTNDQPQLLDVSNPAHPTTSPLAKLGQCPRSSGGTGVAICVDPDGAMRLLRMPDNDLVASLPAPAAGLNAAYVTESGKAVVTSDTTGHVAWYQSGTTTAAKTWSLTGALQGEMLAAALSKGVLSASDAAAVRAGSTSVTVPMSPDQFEINSGQTTIAAIMPTGAISLLATDSDRLIDIPARDGRHIAAAKFSAHGNYLAVVDYVKDAKSVRAMMVVYDAATGTRMFAINCDPLLVPTVHALSDGNGFVTVNPRGTIQIHPVFDRTTDLIKFLAQKYPNPLTASQRRAFFIE